MLGNTREERAKRATSSRDNYQVMLSGEGRNILHLERPKAQMPATPREVLEQARAVNAHVNAHTGFIICAAERQRALATDTDGKVCHRDFFIVPVGDPKLALARTGWRGANHGIWQSAT